MNAFTKTIAVSVVTVGVTATIGAASGGDYRTRANSDPPTTSGAPAPGFDLQFTTDGVLPSARGANFGSLNVTSEGAVYAVSDGYLHQNTLVAPANAEAAYEFFDRFDHTFGASLEFRAKLLQCQPADPALCSGGAAVSVADDGFTWFFNLTPGGLYVRIPGSGGLYTPLVAAGTPALPSYSPFQEHTYRVTIPAGSPNYAVWIDGIHVADGVAEAFPDTTSYCWFGDGSPSGGNAAVEWNYVTLRNATHVLAADNLNHRVVAYDLATLDVAGVLVPSGSGGLISASGMTTSDGYLFVTSYEQHLVLRYDAATGAPAPAPGHTGAVFATNVGNLGPFTGAFYAKAGPDGHIYVSTNYAGAIERYDGATGSPLPSPGHEGSATFGVTLQNGGFDWGPDGNLYVANFVPSSVWRLNGTTGAFIDEFIPTSPLTGSRLSALEWGPDGNLYVSGRTDDPESGGVVRRFDPQGQPLPAPGHTGALVAEFAKIASNLAFGPDGHLYVSNWTYDDQWDLIQIDVTGGVVLAHLPLPDGMNPWGIAFGSMVIDVDHESPAVTCTAADGTWHPANVILDCHATDVGTGLANAADATFFLTTSVAPGVETADAATNTYVVCDNAGNCTTTGPITGNMIDRRGPIVSLAAPAGASYTIGQIVLASYGCSDGGSGVAMCEGPLPGGVPIDTSVPGSFTFTVNATDGVGNASAASVTYTVSLGGTFSSVTPSIWLGLKNSDDVGTKFDLLAEVLKNGVVVGSGQGNAVTSGGSGFNNAAERAVATALAGAATFAPGDTLSIRLSVRIAVGVAGHTSGTARLWFNDAAANSRVDAVVNGVARTLYLNAGSVLGLAPGTGPKVTSDVLVNKNVGGNPFKPFGTWTIGF